MYVYMYILSENHSMLSATGCNFKSSKWLIFFVDASIWNALQLRLKRSNSSEITDVYDGLHYRQHCEFLSQPSHLSLLMNTDGVAIFHSSKYSVWPVFFVINELPKEKR